MMNKYTDRERKIINYIQNSSSSPSHGLRHALRTAEIASALHKSGDGNRDIIIASALFHDIAREFGHDEDHCKVSADMTKELSQFNYSDDEISKIKDCIIHHNDLQPRDISKEALILWDSDKIEGFGAIGLARIFMHCAENKYPFNRAVEMIEKEMAERYEHLHFEDSKKISKNRFEFTRRFLKQLQKELRTW